MCTVDIGLKLRPGHTVFFLYVSNVVHAGLCIAYTYTIHILTQWVQFWPS